MTWLDWKDLHRSHIGRNKKNRAATDESSSFFSFKSINQRPQAKREKWQVFFFHLPKRTFFGLFFLTVFFCCCCCFLRVGCSSRCLCVSRSESARNSAERCFYLSEKITKKKKTTKVIWFCVCVCVSLSRSIRNKKERNKWKIEHKRFATFLTDALAAADT